MALFACKVGGAEGKSDFTCVYNGINSIGKITTPAPTSATIDVTIGGGILVLNCNFNTVTISNISNNIFKMLYDDGTSVALSAGTHDAKHLVAIYADGGALNTRYMYSYSLA